MSLVLELCTNTSTVYNFFIIDFILPMYFAISLQMIFQQLKSGWQVEMGPMGEWRWGLRGCGALSVTTAGTRKMP